MSYHFNSHYNSIIDPQTHFGNVEKNRKAGEIEDERIKLSSLRTQSAYGKSVEISDVLQTEVEYLNAAIRESRRAFENKDFNYDQMMFDKITQQSLKSLDLQFETQMKTAIKESIVEKEKQDIEKDLAKIEAQEIKKAIERSMKIGGAKINDIQETDPALLIGLIESQQANMNNNNNNNNGNNGNNNGNNNNGNNGNGNNDNYGQLLSSQQQMEKELANQQEQVPVAVKIAMSKGISYGKLIDCGI